MGGEEVAELLLVLIGGRGIPGDIGGAAFKEIRHEDTVFLVVGGSEDIGALNGLVEETEDVLRKSAVDQGGRFYE